jgi:hypothetical protein
MHARPGGEAFAWWAACMDLEKPEPFAETITEGLGDINSNWIPLLEFASAAVGECVRLCVPPLR